MKLILTSEVKPLGKKGDVVDVANGYARNYLLPKKLAIPANDGALKQAEAIRAARLEAENRARETAEAMALQLAGSRVVLAAQAGDEGQLYGAINAGDIVEGIARFTGIQLERSQIQITSPIRAIGLHEINVKVHPEVEFPVVIDVIPA